MSDNSIFTFNKHFDKENDCVYEPVNTKPHHWRRLFITFSIVNFLVLKKRKLDLPYEVDCHMCRLVDILLTVDDCSLLYACILSILTL